MDIESTMSEQEIIEIVSTSSKTASTNPIVLNKTDRIQTKFIPNLVENEKEPEKSVSGKIIYEKKQQQNHDFPTEEIKISRQSVKVGEIMEIALNTTETYNLYKGLQTLYSLFEDIGGIPFGNATYTRIDSSFKSFLEIIQNEPSAARMIGHSDNFELVKILLQLITQTDSLDSLKKSLQELDSTNILCLTEAINLERLRRVLNLLEENLDNEDEEFWQSVFTDNQWILSQLFSSPCTIFEDKAYVGGKGLSNRGGNICDFIYQNRLTQNVSLIEIKTPCTPIIANTYRGTYSFSHEMSGAINQVLNYRDNLTKEYYATCHNSQNNYEVFSPKCLVVIGKIDGLNNSQIGAIENYRGSIGHVHIITYDELIMRIRDMIDVFCSNDNTENAPCISTSDDDFPTFDIDDLEDGELPF